MNRLRGEALIPRGVYRFRTHGGGRRVDDPDDRGYSRVLPPQDAGKCDA